MAAFEKTLAALVVLLALLLCTPFGWMGLLCIGFIVMVAGH